jgi:mRNA-degrading endonuclease RelE of RelBE toxin-antitoxin system
MTSESDIHVEFSQRFRKDVKHLQKKFAHIRDDLQPLIDDLSAGQTPGDQIQGTGHTIYKVRLPNQDAGRGKSAGYRVVYYIRTAINIVLLTIYAKTEQSDIQSATLIDIIADLNPDTSDEE